MKTLILVLSQVAVAGVLLSACGGDVVVNDGEGGQGGDATTPTSQGGGATTPTGQGGDPTPTGSTGVTTTPTSPPDGFLSSFAVRRLRIGDTTPDGQPSSTAWKQYGFNLDGKVSNAGSNDLCKPVSGANPASVYPDGDDGIDNSFGRNVLPIFLALNPSMGQSTNTFIEKGGYTVLLQIQGITPGATGTFFTYAATGSFPPNQAPQWDGLDAWPIRSTSLGNGKPPGPSCLYSMSTVSGGAGQRVWQSHTTCSIELILTSQGYEMTIPLREVRMTAVLSDDNTKMTSGRIGGVIDTEQFVAEMAKVAGSLDPSLCPPSATFESIAMQIRQASDILLDGTQNPNATCNGISIGLGFDAEQAKWGNPYDVPVLPNPCAP